MEAPGQKFVREFLKWTAPTKATKEIIDAKSQMRKLTKPPLLMEDKCGNLREVLNCIRSPREWVIDGVIWRQEVSNEPATRLEVLKLAEALDEAMVQTNARETGICDVRQVIFAELFDELIRHISITCIERGLLLLRVRDEIRDSIENFQQLYQSSLGYGIRKMLTSDEDIAVLREEADKLESKKTVLESELRNIRFTIAERERELAEKMEEIASKHRSQLEDQEELLSSLKYQLLTVTSLNKNK